MFRLALPLAALLAAAPALGQQADPPPLPDPNDQSDSFTIGAGVAYIPD